MKKTIGERVLPYLFIAPAFIMIAVFLLYPMIYNLALSFFNYSLASIDRPFVGFDNYVKMFGAITKTKAMKMFREYKSQEQEENAMMFGW